MSPHRAVDSSNQSIFKIYRLKYFKYFHENSKKNYCNYASLVVNENYYNYFIVVLWFSVCVLFGKQWTFISSISIIIIIIIIIIILLNS